MKNFMLICLCVFLVLASDKKLNSKPVKKNALKITERLTIKDEEEGFYKNAYASISPNGKYVVLDEGNKRVITYDNNGNKIHEFGKEGTGPGELNQVYSVGTTKNRIAVRNQMSIILFDYNGKYINDISLMGNGNIGTPTFLDETVFVFYEDGEFVYEIYNEDGKKVDSKPRTGYNPPEDGESRMMIKIGGNRHMPYKYGYVYGFEKEYKFAIYDDKLNKTYEVTRDFVRVKRDIEAMMKRVNIQLDGNMSKKEKQKMISQMKNNIIKQMGEYENDIQGIIGTSNDEIFIRTATGDDTKFELDIVKGDKLYTQFKTQFKDEIRSSTLKNGKLILTFKSDDGPYVKIYDVTLS